MAAPDTCGHLLIIGGGQSARWILFALAEQLVRDPGPLRGIRITVIESQGEFGTGLAWNRHNVLEEHLASRATLLKRWSFGERQQVQFEGTTRLLSEMGSPMSLMNAEEAVDLEQTANGFEVSLRSGARVGANYVVLATGYGTRPWRGKVRQLGVAPFVGRPGVHLAPWPAVELQRVVFSSSKPRHILLLGSYLTAVDTAITLALAAGHFSDDGTGRLTYQASRDFHICMASRSGLLPKVAALELEKAWSLRSFTDSRLRVLMESTANGEFISVDAALHLLGEELGEACLELEGKVPGALRRLSNPTRRLCALRRYLSRRSAGEMLRSSIAEVMSTGRPYGHYEQLRQCAWQAPIDRAIAVWNEWSPWFCAEDVLRFDAELRTVFFNHMLPLTLRSALQIDALLRSEHLRVISLGAEYQLTAQGSGESGYILRHATSGSHSREWFSDIIDATGHDWDLKNTQSTLLRALSGRGLIQPALRPFRSNINSQMTAMKGKTSLDSRGRCYLRTRGIYVNPRTCEAIPRGQLDEAYSRQCRNGLYVVGPNLAGQFADAQSIGQAQRDARRVVADLFRKQISRDGVGVDDRARLQGFKTQWGFAQGE